MGIEVREAVSRSEIRDFLLLPWRVYKNDPLWVPPLLPDRRKAVAKKEAVFFQRGEAAFFVAYRDGEPAGSICAAEDPPTNNARGRDDCVIGFFECIDDYGVAKELFDCAATWAAARRLEYLCGPFNLDYENAYGVLIAGRDRPPALMCGHSPEYYAGFFDRYGFGKNRGDNLAFAAEVNPESDGQKRLDRLAKIARGKGNITVRSADLNDIDAEIDRVHKLLVSSLTHLEGAIPWRRDALEAMLLPLKDLVDPEMILFAESGGEAVGWFPGINNFNELFIKLNGLRYPWNYLKLPGGLKKRTKCIAVKSVLVLPEYWHRGVGILLFDEMAKRAHAKGYSWIDLSLTAEDNPQTPLIAESLGAREYKRYRTYVKPL